MMEAQASREFTEQYVTSFEAQASREFTEQYVTSFEARTYLNGAYTIFKDQPAPYAFYRKGKLTLQHEIFKEGKIRGKRLLEIGSGPTIDFVIIPSHYFDEIYLSDFNRQAREEIQLWRKGAPTAFDWSDHFKFICKLQNNGMTWYENEAALKSKVKDVFYCDVLQKTPLYPEVMDDFDCIITSNCLNTAATTMKDYTEAVGNVTTLLKPGGHFVSFVGLGYSIYKVGSYCFKSLSLDEETFKQSVTDCGLNIKYCNTVSVDNLPTQDKEVADIHGYMILHAVKE